VWWIEYNELESSVLKRHGAKVTHDIGSDLEVGANINAALLCNAGVHVDGERVSLVPPPVSPSTTGVEDLWMDVHFTTHISDAQYQPPSTEPNERR
jgi:hypothetical protein